MSKAQWASTPDGKPTTLRRQSALVLRTLATRRGRNVSQDEAFRTVWETWP